MKTTNVKSLALAQCAAYPGLHLQDVVKALYQAEFGCGHFVSPEGLRYLQQELTQLRESGCAAGGHVEPLDGDFCRVHLQTVLNGSLTPETLHRVFYLSARTPAGEMPRFLQHLDELERLLDGALPIADDDAFLTRYREAGCPPTHHSEAFRALYHPAYRVVAAKYAVLLPLLERLDGQLREKSRVLLAIEGGSASGKSTLAGTLQEIYPDSTVFHMDDFFLQPHQRTPERFAQPGGNVDYERFHAEVLAPLVQGQPVSYCPFDCSTMSLADPVTVMPGRLCIIEGAYSMHPALRDGYDLSVCLTVDADTQRSRIIARNGERLWQRFREEWIPLEHRYFDACHIPDCCTMTLTI